MALADALMRGDPAVTRNCHPGLKNALDYLASNLHEPISLHELSRHAGLSASHLAYLFQKTLGVNFKSLLAALRILEARQLLVDKPQMRITEISFQVGFGDLRHFERTFKRLIGKAPKEYRSWASQSEDPNSW